MRKDADILNYLIWGAVLMMLGAVAIKFIYYPLESSKRAATVSVTGPDFPVYGKVPYFLLTDQRSERLGSADLKGKLWIANFIFTRCAGPCPLMSAHMRSLQEDFESTEDVHLVSFSVDPDYDTPPVLSEYALRFRANPEKWAFLTGDKTEIFDLSQHAFHLGASDVPEEDRKSVGQSVMHSQKFILVDRAGRIRGYYDSTQAEQLKKLKLDARSLLSV